MQGITGNCGKCGAPYSQPTIWHGIGTPPITPSCNCWNMPQVITTTGVCVAQQQEKEVEPSTSNNKQSASASQIADHIETTCFVNGEYHPPREKSISRWIQQLRTFA